MTKLRTIITLVILLTSHQTFAEGESVWCWIFNFQGCPGVSPTSGNARNLNNSGGHGIGNIGGKRDRVETRTIITIPDYSIRRIKRFFGLGGNLINISHNDSDQRCYEQNHTTPRIEHTLLAEGSMSECMEALDNDLRDSPNGIQLNIVQCQHLFCTSKFISKFEEYLLTHPDKTVGNVNQFLTCNNGVSGSVEI